MAVALILASDTEENVVVGGGAVARHIRAHRRAALQSAPVIMGSYYLAAWGGFQTFICPEDGLLSVRILLQQSPALHSDNDTGLDVQWAFGVGNGGSAGAAAALHKHF